MKKALAQVIVMFSLMLSSGFAEGVKSIGSAKEFDALLTSGKPVVADFFATWCPPCQRLTPILDALAQQYGDKATFVRIDVDQVKELANRFEIKGIPDVRFFSGGKQQEQIVGLSDKGSYEKAILKVTK